ncbi:MAG: ABC transporter ATP-binding protein, partial [Eggerthellaceae bacterium]|nr:ABC transporter ATP-binding protein [Eggerthellaceae bacterium]
ELFDVANEQVLQTDSKRMWASTLRGVAVAGIILAMTIALAIFVTGGNAWLGIAPGTLVMMFTYTYTLTTQFDRIGMMLQQTNRSLGDAHEMTKILDEPRLVDDVPNAGTLVVGRGEIDFDALQFSYAGNGEGSEGAHEGSGAQAPGKAHCVFDGFTLHIPAGQRVGLVGRSGSGKTSLTKLLLRLSDLQGGCIRIDGQDISQVTQESLRHAIAYVPQEAILFHRSIRENISYGRPDATDDQILEAARLACALEFIDKLPNGMDTEVGEMGAHLSGGQRQRIAIARAILADCPILVLDEATSALDSMSEQLVQDALTNLMKGRTSIVVAHRLSTVAMLDRIVVLDDGAVVEDGTHAQLLDADGTYAGLWSRQSGAFLDME